MENKFKQGDVVRSFTHFLIAKCVGYSSPGIVVVELDTGDCFKYPEEEWEIYHE